MIYRQKWSPMMRIMGSTKPTSSCQKKPSAKPIMAIATLLARAALITTTTFTSGNDSLGEEDGKLLLDLID
jgi:hypothetical protein